jgi:tetratricopeptide (TPR) repeat protein
MAESTRALRRSVPAAADRDSRVEALLVEGVDRYVAGHYQDAIHLWTRVLFLDRSHARARAYIDRARTALAERQRRTDETLDQAAASLAGGDADHARMLLASLEGAPADDERLAVLSLQVDRLERAQGRRPSSARVRAAVVDAVPVVTRRARWRRTGIVAALAAAAMLVALVAGERFAQGWLGIDAGPLDLPPASAGARTAAGADAILARARTLYSSGRLDEALGVLDRIEAGNPLAREAESLRLEIRQARRRAGSPGGDIDLPGTGRP